MLFGKKRGNSLFSEVDDDRHIVHDFRRRTQCLFENYRAISYKKADNYNLEQLMAENAEVLGKLIAANAIDAGNGDCLVNKVLAPIRDGLCYLDDQALNHMDFYSRQASNMAVHIADIERILEEWKEKRSILLKEHESTKMLWDRYCSYKKKEAKAYEQ